MVTIFTHKTPDFTRYYGHTACPVGEIENVAYEAAEVFSDIWVLVDIATAGKTPVISGTGTTPLIAFPPALGVTLYCGQETTPGAVLIWERYVLWTSSW